MNNLKHFELDMSFFLVKQKPKKKPNRNQKHAKAMEKKDLDCVCAEMFEPSIKKRRNKFGCRKKKWEKFRVRY